ncbi:MAG: site-specific DNA-methyltransferase [Candidatus Peribacteraceae bacterium]|nr:site-specific DNA-methyltransferase [Candidatus Peribacteraceae bacterium]
MSDVPYGVGYCENKFTTGGTRYAPILNDHLQGEEEFSTFTRTWLEAVKPFMARKNTAYVFCGDRMLFAFRDGLLKAGWRFGQILYWLKTAAVLSRLDYCPQHETLVTFWIGAHAFYKSKDKSVIIHPKPAVNKYHPTCKPIPILRRFILNSSRIGDLVYDPFAGSGSTALAAEQTMRRSISIELEPRYCSVILDRLETVTDKKPHLLSPSRHAR